MLAEYHTTSDQSNYNIPAYIPSPQEIRAACRKIQATWSETEKQRRRGYRTLPRTAARYKMSLPYDLEAVA
ncbi:MAG: hypothetical protein KDA78_13500 [Planctomycetaceae bacterium]|nr:hypothetical protein [Planctomycetaceae bacterium]